AAIAFVAILAALTPRAHAASIAATGLQDMLDGAASVVHATAVSSSVHWNERHSMIVTDVRFQVHETLKGEPRASVIVRVPGGRIGKLQVEVPGTAGFDAGSEAILVLAAGPRGALFVSGLSRGRFDVHTDARTRTKLVRAAAPELLTALLPAAAAE